MKHKLPIPYEKMNINEKAIYWVAYWKGYDHSLDRIQGLINEQKKMVTEEKPQQRLSDTIDFCVYVEKQSVC